MAPARPAVTVVMPFFGSAEEAREALARLGALKLGPEDRALLADNTDGAVAAGLPCPDGVQAVVCSVKRSAYAARNIGAERAATPWLLYVDADCVLPAGLIDAYFAEPIADDCGLLAGPVLGDERQQGLAPRYARSRRHLDNEMLAARADRPMAVTANLLVRREAWEQVGGFQEQVRSGADADFCWRVQAAGWRLCVAPAAGLVHEHRSSVRSLLRQAARDGAAEPWLAARHPGYPARPALLRHLLRALAGAVIWPLTLQFERGLMKAFDGVWVTANWLGSMDGNATPLSREVPVAEATVLLAEHPLRQAPQIAEGARVEALARPLHPAWAQWRTGPASFLEDDGPLGRARALLALALARPRALLADLRAGGEVSTWRLAPAAVRVRRTAAGAPVLAGPDMAPLAERLARLAGRRAGAI